MDSRDRQAKNAPDSAAAAAARPQPHDLKVERAVLFAMLREPKPCVDIAIEHLGVDAGVFYSHVHRLIYDTINALYNQAGSHVDLISVAHELSRQNKLEDVGGEVFLAELYGEVPTTVNLDGWCRIVRGYATLRQMIDVCSTSLLKCYDADREVVELIEEIETDIYNVRNSEHKSAIVSIQQSIITEYNTLRELVDSGDEVGISTGYGAIDEITGGLKPGEMFVLAARPSIGKTAIALNIVRNVALSPIRPRCVAFFSLEMTAEQISRRLLCSEAQVPETQFWNHTFNPQDFYKLTQAVEAYKSARIFIDPTPGLTIAELRAKARRLRMMENIEMIVIDYLQLMHADGRIESRQQEVAAISGGLKQLAKELKLPVLVLAQLNREVDKTTGASVRPKLSNLRESGAIEQDADIVAFLHRDRDQAKNLPDGASVEAEVIVEKNRNGRTGYVPMNFFPSRMRFEVASKYKAEDGPAGHSSAQ